MPLPPPPRPRAPHWDRALCHSALAAIATGCRTQGEIAECLGTPLTDASHCLTLLQANGLLYGEPDAFRPNLVRLRISEPLLAFEHAAVWPQRSALEQQDAIEVWRRARPVFDSAVAGPHFAQICRDWVMDYADQAVFGAHPAAPAHGSLSDPEQRAGPDAEADVVVRGRADARSGPLLSVRLARWDEVMDLHHLEQIRRLLTLLAAHGEDVTRTRPGVGFTPALRAAGADGQVVLVDLDRLYRGDQPGGSSEDAQCMAVIRFSRGFRSTSRTSQLPGAPGRPASRSSVRPGPGPWSRTRCVRRR